MSAHTGVAPECDAHDTPKKNTAGLRGAILLVPFEVIHAVLFYPEPIRAAPSAGFPSGFIAVYALVLMYLAVTLRTPKRQGLHDLAAGTIVTRVERDPTERS